MTTITPRTMRAVLLTGHGGFERLDLRDDVPVPEPPAGSVLIRVAAAGVNNTDINTRIGWYAPDVAAATAVHNETAVASGPAKVSWAGEAPIFPRIQGADASGRIVAVGPGVDPDRIGERVIVEPVFGDTSDLRVAPIYFGSEVDGAFAEYTAVPSRHAVRVDCDWTDAQLASIPCSYSAAENMMGRARVSPGETVLITGASGGVGSAAIQLAKRRGARVVAVAAEAKHDELEALGADVALQRDANLVRAIGRKRVDVVVDVVGGPGWWQLLAVLVPGGRYAASGAIAGPIVDLDLRTLYLNDLTLFGCTVLDPGVFANLVGYIQRGEIHPMVAATFALRDIVAAQRLFLTKQHVGKIVLTVGDR